MATGKTITYNGITWGFTHTVTYGEYVNGDPWVLAAPGGGVELSSITPQPTVDPVGTEDANGSMLNYHWVDRTVPVFVATQQNGWHGLSNQDNGTHGDYRRERNWAITQQPNGTYLPISPTNTKVLPVGNSLCSCESIVGNIQFNPPWDNRTGMKRIAVLTCVSAIPPDGSFRPGYGSLDKTPIVASGDIDYGILANLDSSEVSSMLPSSTYADLYVSALKYPFMGYGKQLFTQGADGYNNILCDGYGQAVGTLMNTALAYINTDIVSEDYKKLILNGILQRGVDCLMALERARDVSSAGGAPAYNLFKYEAGGGGHQNSFEMPLVMLAACVGPGELRERCRLWLKASAEVDREEGYPIFQRDNQLFPVDAARVQAANDYLLGTFPYAAQYSSVLCYQASDIGLPEWAHFRGDKFRKGWTREEVIVESNNSGLHEIFTSQYRHCCTAICWIPWVFAYKAMGIEKLVDSDAQALYTERYIRRNDFGPYPEISFSGYTYTGQDVKTVNDSDTGFDQQGTITTLFAKELYTKWVHHSFREPKTAGTVQASLPVSGIESLGVPTESTIYLECSTPFYAGTPNTVYCNGLAGYSPGDFMVLFAFDASSQLDTPFELLGVNLHSVLSIAQWPFTKISTAAPRASVQVPSNIIAKGGEYLLQAIVIRAIDGELVVRATNALKVKLF